MPTIVKSAAGSTTIQRGVWYTAVSVAITIVLAVARNCLLRRNEMDEELNEYRLPDFNWDTPGAKETLVDLYKSVLHEDSRWHFFWEGSYSLLRFQAHFTSPVISFLHERDISYTYEGKWKDNIWVTEKYQSIFEGMFHSFSVMAMEMEFGDLEYVFDRVVHCFLNMSTSQELWTEMERKHGGWAKLWEPFMASEYAAKRAITLGRMM
jgi:hypothetical protein